RYPRSALQGADKARAGIVHGPSPFSRYVSQGARWCRDLGLGLFDNPMSALAQSGHGASLNGPHLNRYDAPVRSLGGGNETARVHQFTRRCGGCVAVYCKRATNWKDVADRVPRASSASLERRDLEAFRQTLRDLGHVEGENITIEYRWAEGD